MEQRKATIFRKGEVTGHSHKTYDKVEFKDDVLNSKGCLVEHEQHKAVELPEGELNVGQVNEFNPYSEEIRKVQD